MKYTAISAPLFFVILLLIARSCFNQGEDLPTADQKIDLMPTCKPLLASRFKDLDDLKKVVDIDYEVYGEKDGEIEGLVRLSYDGIETELQSGISQDDIIKVRDGKIMDAVDLMIESPYAIRNRVDLNKIYKLARRRPLIFGEGDVAFYDLALACVSNMNFDYTYIQTARDTSEKGFINTYNHIIAQALITTAFSKEMADFLADVHELKNMPELIHGNFSIEQLVDSNNNPVDNYVDIVNNEIGQQIGIALKVKYGISSDTEWDNVLLTAYMNEIWQVFCKISGVVPKPFVIQDPLLNKIAKKINRVRYDLTYFSVK